MADLKNEDVLMHEDDLKVRSPKTGRLGLERGLPLLGAKRRNKKQKTKRKKKLWPLTSLPVESFTVLTATLSLGPTIFRLEGWAIYI